MYIILIILAVIAAVIGIIVFLFKKYTAQETDNISREASNQNIKQSYYHDIENKNSSTHVALNVLVALNFLSFIAAIITVVVVSSANDNYELLLNLIYIVPVGITSIAVPVIIQKRLDEKHAYETSMQESLRELVKTQNKKDN